MFENVKWSMLSLHHIPKKNGYNFILQYVMFSPLFIHFLLTSCLLEKYN